MSANKAKLEALLRSINSAAHRVIAEYEKAGGDVPSIDSADLHPLDNSSDNVVLESDIRTLRGACAQLCTTLAPPSQTAIDLVKVYDHACVRVALRENISDILADCPKGVHIHKLSKIINIDPKKLARLMRLLVARGCYNEVEEDTFANNRLSLMLHSKHPIRDLVSLHVEMTAKGSTVLYETLKDPKTAYSENSEHAPVMYASKKEGFTGTFFDWLKQEDDRRESYQRAMTTLNGVMRSLTLLEEFPFEKYSTIVDVGGGLGAVSLLLAKKYRHVKVTIQDLPEVLVQARRVWKRDCPEAVQENRIEFVALDFLTQSPVKGKDIYYLRNIVHDWPDHKAEVILRNIRQALGPHSRVLVHDQIALRRQSQKRTEEEEEASGGGVSAFRPTLFDVGAYQQDLTMWILHNAKERTLQNSLALATGAGLKLEKVWDLVESCVLEFSAAPSSSVDRGRLRSRL